MNESSVFLFSGRNEFETGELWQTEEKKSTKKFWVKPYKYSMGEEDDDEFFIPFKSLYILLFLSLVFNKVFKTVSLV